MTGPNGFFDLDRAPRPEDEQGFRAVVWIADDELFHATCSRLAHQGVFLKEWHREHVICESREEMHRQVEIRAREAGFAGGFWNWHQTPQFLEEHFEVRRTRPRGQGSR